MEVRKKKVVEEQRKMLLPKLAAKEWQQIKIKSGGKEGVQTGLTCKGVCLYELKARLCFCVCVLVTSSYQVVENSCADCFAALALCMRTSRAAVGMPLLSTASDLLAAYILPLPFVVSFRTNQPTRDFRTTRAKQTHLQGQPTNFHG